MITSNEQNEQTEQDLINEGLAEFGHHPVFKEITEHEERLKQIEDTKQVFWKIATQILENSGSEVQAEERLGKLTKATLIDVQRILEI